MIDFFKSKKIAVLAGGASSEQDVSINSATLVHKHLNKLGYLVDFVKLNSLDQFDYDTYDVFVNTLHGGIGENGALASILECLGKSFTGCSSHSASLAWDKIAFKNVLKYLGIPHPTYYPASAKADMLTYPIIFKPREGGSSINTFIVNNPNQLTDLQSQFSESLSTFFLEDYIKGVEITVGILDTGTTLIELPVLEIEPKHHFYDYECKYKPGKSLFSFNKKTSLQNQLLAQRYAKAIHQACRCLGATRVDMIIDKNNIPHILELNTSPGLTSTSDIPMQAQNLGIHYSELVEILLLSAIYRSQ